MSHTQIKNFIEDWNIKNPDKPTSYTSLYYAKISYEKEGVAGLLSKWGKGSNRSDIPEEYLEYYKSLYLREGGPSSFFCWTATLGYAKEKENIDVTTFPSYKTFERRLRAQVPQQAIYMARCGNAAWNRKYHLYLFLLKYFMIILK